MNQVKRTLKLGAFHAVAFFACGALGAEEPVTAPKTEEPPPSAEMAAAPAPKTVDPFLSAGSKTLALSYGYVTTDYDDANTDAEGWRVNASFEMNPKGGPLVHGLTIGYMETSAERTGVQTVEYDVRSVPIYYAPKMIFGKKAIKVFAKGALGCQFSKYNRSGGANDVSANEVGFYGGGSLGAMLVLKEKFFINAEYEWAYMSNAGYQSGAAESALIGIGAKF